jgi:hypothetical protein
MSDHPATDGTTEELPVTWEGRAKNGARFNVRFSDLLALLEELDVPQSLALTDVVLPETSKRLRAALSAQQSAERQLEALQSEREPERLQVFRLLGVVEAARELLFNNTLTLMERRQNLHSALRALEAAPEGEQAPAACREEFCSAAVEHEGEFCPRHAATEGGKTSGCERVALCAKCHSDHHLSVAYYDHDFEPAPPQTEGECQHELDREIWEKKRHSFCRKCKEPMWLHAAPQTEGGESAEAPTECDQCESPALYSWSDGDGNEYLECGNHSLPPRGSLLTHRLASPPRSARPSRQELR